MIFTFRLRRSSEAFGFSLEIRVANTWHPHRGRPGEVWVVGRGEGDCGCEAGFADFGVAGHDGEVALGEELVYQVFGFLEGFAREVEEVSVVALPLVFLLVELLAPGEVVEFFVHTI